MREQFGVPPASIPDYLALVGDSADGFPGLPGWGAKSAAAVLARYGHLDAIPGGPGDWDVPVRGAARLAQALVEGRGLAELFRVLATLRTDAAGVLPEGAEALRWRGPASELPAVCDDLDAPRRPRPRGGAGGRARLGRGHRGVAQDSRAPQTPLRKALGAAGPMGSRPPRRPDARRRREARRSLPWTPRELGLRETARPGRGR